LSHDGRCAVTNLCDLDDDDDGRLAFYFASSWFETCCTTLDLLGDTLIIDDVVLEDKTIQTGGSRAIDEANSFTRCLRRYK